VRATDRLAPGYRGGVLVFTPSPFAKKVSRLR
jgi:hypothetical protein